MSHPCKARNTQKQSMFRSIAWHVPSEIYRSIWSGTWNVLSKNASDVFPSLGISEAKLPKLVGKTLPISGALLPIIGCKQPTTFRRHCFQ